MLGLAKALPLPAPVPANQRAAEAVMQDEAAAKIGPVVDGV